MHIFPFPLRSVLTNKIKRDSMVYFEGNIAVNYGADRFMGVFIFVCIFYYPETRLHLLYLKALFVFVLYLFPEIALHKY